MCGIAGIYGKISPATRQNALCRMSSLLTHRGPDGNGFYTDDTVGMVHTRLSIIDLSEQGNQPLFNEDKTLVLICNGEIYNYREIRKELVEKGHKFNSNSDCEVILHLYEEYNADHIKLLSRLTGMFAFALWDIRKKELFVARDRIGIKPLYYSYNNNLFSFASEVAAVTVTGLQSYSLDETSLYEYFMLGSVPGPHTIYKEVKALPAGNFATIDKNGVKMKEYWDIPLHTNRQVSERDLLDEAELLFSEVVKDHLVADVPVGTFLSAGVDSSLITAVAAKHQAGIYSFTASFPGEPEDEGAIAADTAQKLGTNFHSYQLSGDFFKDFEYHFRHIDQPFGITSALSLARISEMAQANIKVVLSGDGADELFAGYARHEPYWQPPFLEKIPSRFQHTTVATAARLTRRKSLQDLNKQMELTEGEKFLSRTQAIAPATVASLLSNDIMKRIDARRYINHLDGYFAKRKDRDEVNRMLYVDMKTTLVDEMLTKCDRMTMRHKIEGRVPFLDYRFVEFAFRIPSTFKRREGVGKLLLRKMLASKLGDTLAYRKKTGFNSPLRQWLHGNVETRNYAGAKLTEVNPLYFNPAAISAMKEDVGAADPNSIFYLLSAVPFLQK